MCVYCQITHNEPNYHWLGVTGLTDEKSAYYFEPMICFGQFSLHGCDNIRYRGTYIWKLYSFEL